MTMSQHRHCIHEGVIGEKADNDTMSNIGPLAFSNAREPNYSPSANAVKLGTAPK